MTRAKNNPLTQPAPWLETPLRTLLGRCYSDRAPKALLLTGRKGLGKRTLATSIHAGRLCLKLQEAAKMGLSIPLHPCGQCQSCLWLERGHHPDSITLSGTAEIPIADIRNIIQFAHQSAETGYKVVQINNAERLNLNAANSLLKILEEPPNHFLFLLTSSVPRRLPATIISRCEALPLRGPSPEMAVEWLTKVASIPPNEASELLRLSYHAPYQALQLHNGDYLKKLLPLQQQLMAIIEGDSLTDGVKNLLEEGQLLFQLLLYWLSERVKGQSLTSEGGLTPKMAAQLNRLSPKEALQRYDALLQIQLEERGTQLRTDWAMEGWFLTLLSDK